jgi:hypothetical protein
VTRGEEVGSVPDSIGVRRGVSKVVEDGFRPPTLQDVEGSGVAGVAGVVKL